MPRIASELISVNLVDSGFILQNLIVLQQLRATAHFAGETWESLERLKLHQVENWHRRVVFERKTNHRCIRNFSLRSCFNREIRPRRGWTIYSTLKNWIYRAWVLFFLPVRFTTSRTTSMSKQSGIEE
jgi:hypothetical protein